jgi:nucleoside-diphosphate-sugar epimerase
MSGMRKKLLIFGVTGFVGKNLGYYLQKNVSTSDLYVVGVVSGKIRKPIAGIDCIEIVDIIDEHTIQDILRKFRPDYIINCIGLFSNASYQELIKSNVDISHYILQAIVDSNSLETRLLFIGSAAEYGAVATNSVSEDNPTKPISLYGLSKLLQTCLVRFYYDVYKVQSVVARTFNLTGQGISSSLSVGNFYAQINATDDGGVVKVGNLDSERDFIEIETAVSLYMSLLQYGKAGEVYNVCSGKLTRVGDLLADMIAKSGKTLFLEVSSQLVKSNDISQIYGSRSKLDALLSENGII